MPLFAMAPSLASALARIWRHPGGRWLLAGCALASPAVAFPAAAKVLYTLETKCAIQGAAPLPCRVEAVDEGGATLYRHRIGETVRTVRVSAEPTRMALWDAPSRSWRNLRNAEARFSTNTICFNNRDLCVVNPNYLNSLLEDRPDLRGRDSVSAHFGADGRVDVICYDKGCDLLSQPGQGGMR
jgi:hypothetical protein